MLSNTTVFISRMLILCLFFVTCKKEDEPTGSAQLLFINGLTDGRMSTVLISDSTYAELHAAFGQFTQYHRITSGNQNFKLRDNTLDSIIGSKTLNVSIDRNYSLMAAGTTANVELVLKEDDLSIPDSTKGYIRLINLSQNSLPMTMSVTAGADLATNIAYKSASGFVVMDPGKYGLTIKSGNTVIINTPTQLSVGAKKKYSILISGLVNQTPKANYDIIVNK